LYAVLEESLNMEQVKLLAHPNGEYYDTYNAYHDLKKHVLEFAKEQFSCDILFYINNSTSWQEVRQDV
jgi:hypothetical protein